MFSSFFIKPEDIHFIFILPNIYEILNGVSLKYIKFIDYLKDLQISSHKIHITLFLTKSKKSEVQIPSSPNIQLIFLPGIRVPFYKEIKVPILHKSNIIPIIKHKNTNIIFHGEFIWLYSILEKIKKKNPDIHLFPNWHTDYEFYLQNVYNIFKFSSSIIHKLQVNLLNKTFSGIIVTGYPMVLKYKEFTNHVFNANELDLSTFHLHKIDTYEKKKLNVIYTGRISKEKNIESIFSYLHTLTHIIPFHLHLIGDGPHLHHIKNIASTEYPSISCTFYGKMNQIDIFELYHKLEDRIFLFTSQSETFGKTPLEACACGIPVFIEKSQITPFIYTHLKNAFIFENHVEFTESIQTFIQWNSEQKKKFIYDSIQNCEPFRQEKIFLSWFKFLIQQSPLQKELSLSYMDYITFHSISNLIQCSSHIIGEK